jgi:hypothetical protein
MSKRGKAGSWGSLFLVLWWISILTSVVVALVHSPTKSGTFLTIICRLFSWWWPIWLEWDRISAWFCLYFPYGQRCWTFRQAFISWELSVEFIFPLVIWIIYSFGVFNCWTLCIFWTLILYVMNNWQRFSPTLQVEWWLNSWCKG